MHVRQGGWSPPHEGASTPPNITLQSNNTLYLAITSQHHTVQQYIVSRNHFASSYSVLII